MRNGGAIFPPGHLVGDGKKALKVYTRHGVLWLNRQVLYDKENKRHLIPGNRLLPEHQGVLVTRRLQEEACLLSEMLPFESASRLLGWKTGAESISDNTIRRIAQDHGAALMRAEAQEVEALASTEEQQGKSLHVSPHYQMRRRPGWPKELQDAVTAALEEEQPQAPDGVSQADWERVLAARREESLEIEDLRRLGPLAREHEAIATLDEVLTRHQGKTKFQEVYTARWVNAEGYRYFSGEREQLLATLNVSVALEEKDKRLITFISDGAQWIRDFFDSILTDKGNIFFILDWYHLKKKIHLFASMICRNKEEKKRFEQTLYRHLWRGQVTEALTFLDTYFPQAKNTKKLLELKNYLQKRVHMLVNYRKRYRLRRFIGSGHIEKGNDLIVARRQKKKGMAWKQKTSHALAALKTLMLNQGWDDYWRAGRLPPLAVS